VTAVAVAVAVAVAGEIGFSGEVVTGRSFVLYGCTALCVVMCCGFSDG